MFDECQQLWSLHVSNGGHCLTSNKSVNVYHYTVKTMCSGDNGVSKYWGVPITLVFQHSTHGANHTTCVFTIHPMCLVTYTLVLTTHPMFECRLFEHCCSVYSTLICSDHTSAQKLNVFSKAIFLIFIKPKRNLFELYCT